MAFPPRPRVLKLAAAIAFSLAAGCGDSAPSMVPTPTPTPFVTPPPGAVVVGGHTGPTQITFVTAEAAAGARSTAAAAKRGEIAIEFDEADPACAVPATISDMKVVLNAPVETASLQEWALRYELRP